MEERELCAAPLLIFDGEGVKGVVELPRKNVVIVSDTNTMVKEITNVQGCDASKVDSSNAARHTIIQLMLQELGKRENSHAFNTTRTQRAQDNTIWLCCLEPSSAIVYSSQKLEQ